MTYLNVYSCTIAHALKQCKVIEIQNLKSTTRLLHHHKTARLEFANKNMTTNLKNVHIYLKLLLAPHNRIFWIADYIFCQKETLKAVPLCFRSAFCADGCLKLTFAGTVMDSSEYTEILRLNLLPFLLSKRRSKHGYNAKNNCFVTANVFARYEPNKKPFPNS